MNYDRDVLAENAAVNKELTDFIERIYGAAMIALIGIVATTGVNAIKQGQFSITQTVTTPVLFVLSIQSLIFYRRVVRKMRDTERGSQISRTLPFVFFASVVFGIFLGLASFLGIGLVAICTKSYQLFLLVRKHTRLKITTTYFFRFFLVYMLAFLILFPYGVLVDFGVLPSFQWTTRIPEYDIIKQELDKISSNASSSNVLSQPIPTDILSESLQELTEKLKQSMSLNLALLTALAVSALTLLFYLLYRFFVVRKITVEIVLRELSNHYLFVDNKSRKPRRKGPPDTGTAAMKLLALFSLIRPVVSAIAGSVSASIYSALSHNPSIIETTSIWVIVFLTSGYGFTLNDFFDRVKDRITHPERPLPQKRVSPAAVIVHAAIVGVCSLVVSITLNPIAFLINVSAILLLSVYSHIKNHYGVWANAITAILSAFVPVMAMSTGNINLSIVLISISTFFIVYGREILLDIRDFASDEITGRQSLPVRVGEQHALWWASGLFSIGSIVALGAAIVWGDPWFLLFTGLLGNLLLWMGFLHFVKYRTIESLNRFRLCTQFMFICVIPATLL